MIYDVLITSLAKSYRSRNQRWVRGIKASSLADASRQAEAKYPNLGLTPTATSMAWPVWPQPATKGG